jgi:ABC-type multidrug transport system ATPase subunit
VPPAITTSGLSKRFGKTVALDGLTLEVDGGEVFGFLGPNGAGKTTRWGGSKSCGRSPEAASCRS